MAWHPGRKDDHRGDAFHYSAGGKPHPENPLNLKPGALLFWRRLRRRMFMGAADIWLHSMGRNLDDKRYPDFKAMIEHETVGLGATISLKRFWDIIGAGNRGVQLGYYFDSINKPDTRDRDGLIRI